MYIDTYIIAYSTHLEKVKIVARYFKWQYNENGIFLSLFLSFYEENIWNLFVKKSRKNQ